MVTLYRFFEKIQSCGIDTIVHQAIGFSEKRESH